MKRPTTKYSTIALILLIMSATLVIGAAAYPNIMSVRRAIAQIASTNDMGDSSANTGSSCGV